MAGGAVSHATDCAGCPECCLPRRGVLNSQSSLTKTAQRIARKHGLELHEIDVAALSRSLRQRDPLVLRAMWRRQRRPLERKTGYVPGCKPFRFLAP